MLKRKINNKTVIIAVFLIFTMIISVFAINGAIQTNKATTNGSIAPYTYKMVLAYFEYWKDGNTYLADVPNESGKVVRKDIGKNPEQYVEWDYWFPVVTLPGNYEIESIMNLVDYKGSWADLNYKGGIPERDVRDYYMDTAVIHNEDALIGASNTTVKFQASFKPLSPDKAEIRKDVYRCYIAIVIKYKNLDYVEPPVEPEEPEEPENPGSGDSDVMVYVYYKEKETGKTLADLQKVRTSMGSNLVLSSKSIDGYKCSSSSIKGLSTKNYETNYINEVVGRYDYTTPPDGYLLTVTFYYEKSDEKPSDNWCDPEFDFDADSAHIQMKRSEFEKLKDEDNIFFPDVQFSISNMKFGKKDGKEMPGQHGFESWDIYFKYTDKGYDYQRYGLMNKREKISLNVPKKYFKSDNEENSTYRAGIEAHAGLNCICGGFTAERDSTSVFVDIIENQPPDANYEYSTLKTLPSGQKSRVYNKAYVGKDVIIDNYCDDPNGTKDIDYVIYTFRNLSGQEKKLKFKMQPWIEYEQVSADDFTDTSIIYKGADNGNLNMIFTNDEEWEVTIYVQDKDGMSDTYTDTIKPEELTLKPTAVIKDTREYTYPYGQNFNGKQNRVIKLDSNSSYAAAWFSDLNVTIDHEKDMWSIEPMDGQSISSVKLERDINKNISSNILNARYEPLDIKLMFKVTGRYKMRLQVTDTDGNVSDWIEQIITIHPDLPPTVSGIISNKFYRNSNGVASLYLTNINTFSSDMDGTLLSFVGYRYDSNNDGNFEDETLVELKLSGNSTSMQTSRLGKYQFLITAKESFGQESLSKYIEDKDYKTSSIFLITEVDNIAPTITKFKIMRMEE